MWRSLHPSHSVSGQNRSSRLVLSRGYSCICSSSCSQISSLSGHKLLSLWVPAREDWQNLRICFSAYKWFRLAFQIWLRPGRSWATKKRCCCAVAVRRLCCSSAWTVGRMEQVEDVTRFSTITSCPICQLLLAPSLGLRTKGKSSNNCEMNSHCKIQKSMFFIYSSGLWSLRRQKTPRQLSPSTSTRIRSQRRTEGAPRIVGEELRRLTVMHPPCRNGSKWKSETNVTSPFVMCFFWRSSHLVFGPC